MKLYNSLHNKIEEFKPIVEGKVSMYACGPTVYNYPHIGNARPIVIFDTLKKTFEASGYEVKYVSNFTDVDDKIIKKAQEEGVKEDIISERYIEAYNADRKSLHASMPDATPRVTDTMETIVAFIKDLVDTGFAYEIDGDVYFRVNKVESYGKLSGQKIEDLIVGARIDENDKKESPLDFTLWKQTETGIKWDSPWGFGRPGWHTECVVMIAKEFGGTPIDIHGGGMDLKFPHHENEMAQSCAHDHSGLANYWVHNGMVNIDGEKMSKSLGNVIWARDFIEKLGGNLVRWVLLSAHYRAPLNISEETIDTARKELDKVSNPLKQAYVKLSLAKASYEGELLQEEFLPFLEAMQDDLNTENAFMALFDTVKRFNQNLRQREIQVDVIANYITTIQKMLYVLGIEIAPIVLSDEDRLVYQTWNDAKANKDFEQADALRQQLQEKGIL
ncbi:cysteine--tRNA ligase [Erysipelotrichaceae bacterium MTC7]|nr:cysteine--tRNA ligase [Erysipelotrichaceae bacterium MTC7]